jgi:hypothetical protein
MKFIWNWFLGSVIVGVFLILVAAGIWGIIWGIIAVAENLGPWVAAIMVGVIWSLLIGFLTALDQI